MAKDSSNNRPTGLTRSGNKFFNGAESGVPFTSTRQPTPEQKRAGWAKKKAREEFVRKIYGKLLDLANSNELTNREIIDLGKIAIEISGDKKMDPTVQLNMGIQKVFVTEEDRKRINQKIDDLIDG